MYFWSSLKRILSPRGIKSITRRVVREITKFRLYQYILFPLVMVYYEILLRLFTKTPLFKSLFYPVIFALSAGFLLAAVTSFFRTRVRMPLTAAIMGVVAFFFGLEAVLRNTYQVYMSLSAVFSEVGNVTGNYGGDVKRALVGAIPIIILYFIPFALHLIFARRLRHHIRRRRMRYTVTLFVLWFLLGCLGTLFASHLSGARDKYAAHFEYDTATRTFGLTEGTYLNFKYSVFGNRKAESFTITTPVPEETVEETAGETVETEQLTDSVETAYNVMDIDFDELIAETSNQNIKSIHEYVSSLEPTNKNEYTGLFEGKNLITITAESFAMQAINEDLTPTLYRMANQGIKFTDFYQPAWGGSTTTGEYAIINGLVPTDDVNSMTDTIGENMYFTTGNQLQRLGYTSLAFHNGTHDYYSRYETHPNLGYDRFLAFGNGLEELTPKWSSDEDTIRATFDLYADNQPFNVYYMTADGHGPYLSDTEDNDFVEKYLDQVKEALGEDSYEDATLYYFCYQMELENALTALLELLEDAGIADDTVIVLCPDHYPYYLAESASFGNDEDYLADLYKVESYDGSVRDKTTLIIWSESIEGMNLEVDTPTSSLDILPTVSNLFGLEYDSRLLVGRDVFSDAEPLVIWADQSFLTEKGWYNADTGVFVATTDEEVTDEYLDRIKTLVENRVAFSYAVPKYDYYGILFGEDDVK